MILPSNTISRMAILSGNLMSKTAIQLQTQVLLVPWLKKKMKIGNVSITCSKRRDYSNSVPVRYIPKRASENKHSEVSSKPISGFDNVKMHSRSESNENRVVNSSSGQTSRSRGEFRNKIEKPVNSINYDIGLGTGKVVQSNVQRLELSKSVETLCSSRSFVADTDFQSQNQNPSIGLDKSRVVGSNAEIELSNGVQTLSSSRCFDVDYKFQKQEEKRINNAIDNVALNKSRGVQSNLWKDELSQSMQTLCDRRSLIVDTDFQNKSDLSINCIKYDVGSDTGRVVQSNARRSEASPSVQTSSSRSNFVLDAAFQYQHEKKINSINSNFRSDTSRVLQSNIQRVELSNNMQTSSRSIVGDTKFQNQYETQVDYDIGLGVGEELGGDMQYEGYEFMEELEGFSGEESNEGHGIQVKQDVEKLAVELLAARAFTAVELRKKLLGKKFPLGVVDAVITDFQGRGLINDGLYAETFSRSRWSSSTWGPKRIKKALYSKGVSDVDTEKAIKLVFNDAAARGDQESGLGMSKLSMDHLLAQASKQWQRSCGVPGEKRKARIVRWLQYRGFSWSIISFVLKELESQYPS